MSFFFPSEPRRLPGQRGVKILFRAAHVLAAGVLTGGYLLEAGATQRSHWLLAAVVTGLLILALDLYESGVFLVQTRGLVVVGKIALLAALPAFGPRAGWVLAALVLVSVLASHAPSRVRYHLLAGAGRLKGAQTKG